VLKAIKDGYVDGTMLQNPYGQGYIGAYALDRIRNGCKVKADAPFKTIALTNRFIDSGTVYADKSAVDNYVGSMQAITKTIFADFAGKYLTCP
jgi:ribose transport system substrate-binding protein